MIWAIIGGIPLLLMVAGYARTMIRHDATGFILAIGTTAAFMGSLALLLFGLVEMGVITR